MNESSQLQKALLDILTESLLAFAAQAQEDMARQKASLTSDSSSSTKKASDRFVGKFDSIEDTLKKSTIGLVSAEDFKKRREELEELKRREAAETSER